MSAIRLILDLSICRCGKCSSRSLNVKIESSFFKRSPRCGPTPLRYSIGLDNIVGETEINDSLKQR
jgi:hypothetical protein